MKKNVNKKEWFIMIFLSFVFTLGIAYFVFFSEDKEVDVPKLYSSAYKSPFTEGMVVPASEESDPTVNAACNIYFDDPDDGIPYTQPQVIYEGDAIALFVSFSSSIVHYEFNCPDSGLSSFTGDVPPADSNWVIHNLYPIQGFHNCRMYVTNFLGSEAECFAPITVNLPCIPSYTYVCNSNYSCTKDNCGGEPITDAYSCTEWDSNDCEDPISVPNSVCRSKGATPCPDSVTCPPCQKEANWKEVRP